MSDWTEATDPVQPEKAKRRTKGVDAQRRAQQMLRIKDNRLKPASTVPNFFVLDDFDEMGA